MKPRKAHESYSFWEARLPRYLTFALLVIGAIVMVMPFAWMVSTSIKARPRNLRRQHSLAAHRTGPGELCRRL